MQSVTNFENNSRECSPADGVAPPLSGTDN